MNAAVARRRVFSTLPRGGANRGLAPLAAAMISTPSIARESRAATN
jgi:hypothetical protein